MTVRRDYSHNPISRTRSNTPLHPSLTRTQSLQAGGVKVLKMKTYGAALTGSTVISAAFILYYSRRLDYAVFTPYLLCPGGEV